MLDHEPPKKVLLNTIIGVEPKFVSSWLDDTLYCSWKKKFNKYVKDELSHHELFLGDKTNKNLGLTT